MLDDIVTDIVADPVDVPVRPPQQSLHAIRRHLTRPLGQRPPILPLQTGDQARHILPHPSTRLRSGEPVGDPLMHPIQLCHHEINHHHTMIHYGSSKCRCSIKPPAPGVAVAVLPAGDELVARIRQVYAEVLQYPIEVIEEGAELEADLGVSSLKHTQAFVKLLDLFGLPTPGAEIRVFSYRTVGQIAGLLQQLAEQQGSHAAV